MQNTNPFPLLKLPIDIQCEILKYPLSLHEFLALREISKDVLQRLNNCAEILDGDGDGYLLPDLVLDMKKIRVIAPDYPIYISTWEEISTIAKHLTLREASFDISPLIIDEGEDDLYVIVNYFFKNFTLSQQKSTCQGCNPSHPAYRFFFFYTNNITGDIQGIEISQGGINLINPPLDNYDNLTSFYKTQSRMVPICEYRGPLNEIAENIDLLPCLSRVYYKLDHRYNQEKDPFVLSEDLLSRMFSNTRIAEYYLSYPKATSGVISAMRLVLIVLLQGILLGSRGETQPFPHEIQPFPMLPNSLLPHLL